MSARQKYLNNSRDQKKMTGTNFQSSYVVKTPAGIEDRFEDAARHPFRWCPLSVNTSQLHGNFVAL